MSDTQDVPDIVPQENVQVEKNNDALEQELASLKTELKDALNEINSLKALPKEIEILKEQLAKKEESYEPISGSAAASISAPMPKFNSIDDYITYRLHGGNV